MLKHFKSGDVPSMCLWLKLSEFWFIIITLFNLSVIRYEIYQRACHCAPQSTNFVTFYDFEELTFTIQGAS